MNSIDYRNIFLCQLLTGSRVAMITSQTEGQADLC